MRIEKLGEELVLDKERALFLPQHQLLAISDLHLGKSGHFRREGLQIPVDLAHSDLGRLTQLIQKYQPEILLVNGDMFHHDINIDIHHFEEWRNIHHQTRIVLVKGNHDKLKKESYDRLGIETEEKRYQVGAFTFVHQLKDHYSENSYPITGHIHPGVSMKGLAKQRLKFPCFYFGEQHAILPAFSIFTGLCTVYAEQNDQVYAIMPNKIIEV